MHRPFIREETSFDGTRTATLILNRLFAMLLALLPVAGLSSAEAVPQLAATPPMGWNSWNHLGASVSEKDVRAAADALVTTGLRDVGYSYVNIDDGWQGERSASGQLQPNSRFGDMKALGKYLHDRGLKFGIYSSPGLRTCAGRTGSLGFEKRDARTFAEWGVDFLKYDICSYRAVIDASAHGDPQLARDRMVEAYEKMHNAIEATGRPMLMSFSQHGLSSPWLWAAGVGANMWRTGDDVRPAYTSVTEIGFAQSGLGRFAGPGHWNDPDMLEIGNEGLTIDECKTQMSLWALLAAPLIAGNDLTKMSPEVMAVLKEPTVIAIDQDPAGRQGDRVWTQGPLEVWSRRLADGSIAVGIFNRNQGALDVTLSPRQLGLQQIDKVKDVWLHRDLGGLQRERTFRVLPHGVTLLVVSGPKQVA